MTAPSSMGGPSYWTSNGSIFRKEGGHYNIFEVRGEEAMEKLRRWFPDGKADSLNFVLFSTSGVHGSYQTIEEAHAENCDESSVTFLVCMPRLVCMHYGNVFPKSEDDWKFLMRLRASSWSAVKMIGRQDPRP